MVVAIVAITTVAKVISDIAKVRKNVKIRDDELIDRIGVLEDRIKVLEQIVTDKKGRLRDEIDSL